MRCINFYNYTDSVRHLLSRDKILQVDELFKLELSKFMYKFVNGKLPGNFDDYFLEITTKHNYQTRVSKDNFFIPRKNSRKGFNSLNYLGPKLWSEIPQNIKSKKSLNSFVLSYKKFLLETYK